MLRDTETGEQASAPLPTWADLPPLVEQAREAGVHVEFDDRIDADVPVPDVVGRTLYRIVQEGITNAAKHAPGAVLRIEVRGSPDDGVDITLRNPIGFGASRTPGSGLGLIGLTERASSGAAGSRVARRSQLRAARLDTVGRVMPPSPIRILIVDDDPLVRSALTFMLGGQADLEVVGEAGDGRAGVERGGRAAARRGADGHPDATAQRARGHPRAARA